VQTSADAVYLDSSALVKLAVEESESNSLKRYLAGRPRRVSCALARVEVVRAVRRHGPAVVTQALQVLDDLYLIDLGVDLLLVAAELDPMTLRSLDAIHLAAARSLGGDLSRLVTYDHRMAEAARRLGLTVDVPGPNGPSG
jgi:predicted nucleic acid-binding protein